VLEKTGYVVRARSESDARQIVNKLTRKGTRCVDSLCCDERSVFDALYDRIPTAKRAVVLEALAVLADAIGGTGESTSAECCAAGSPPNHERYRT
jgi:DNA-binding MarR family transcriptional regulator